MKLIVKKTIFVLLLFSPLTTHANDININQAKIIDINTPLKNHISFNTFETLSSNEHGLIFNNDITSNNKLHNAAAKLILAEVTGIEESHIQGVIGIKGQRTNLVIANPNGISWKNGTVNNINSLSLVAGKLEPQYTRNKDNKQLEPKKQEDYSNLKFSIQPASLISISQQHSNPIQLSKMNIFADHIKLQNNLNINAALQNYISASGSGTLSPSEGVIKYGSKFKTDIPHIQGNLLELDEHTKLTGRSITLESHQYQCKDDFLCPQNKIDIHGVIKTMNFSLRGNSEISLSNTGVIQLGKNLQALVASTPK
ncbi:filamentous hemagglutinin N-terminal domain-containing protein [Providencia rettgeri]|uniref:two-partner secretion domain-containing protein n=1 Tax=Providencia rettgeri TaxID=587 RepID=UPI0034E06A54